MSKWRSHNLGALLFTFTSAEKHKPLGFAALQIHIPGDPRYPAPVNYALVLVSALLLPLALPNELFVWGVPALGIVALVPLFLALYRTSTLSVRSSER